MALLFLDGFEGYATQEDFTRQNTDPNICYWRDYYNGLVTASTIYRTQQVTPTNSRSIGNYSTPSRLQLNLPSLTEVIAGVGVYPELTGAISILNVGGTGYTSQGICLGGDLTTNAVTVSIPNGSGLPGTAIATAPGQITLSTWHYFELRVKLGAANGEIEVWLDGNQIINVTNVNTASGGLAAYNTLTLNVSPRYTYMDDLYVCDTTGTTNNTFLGPTSVYTLMPNGDGSSTQLTPMGAATNWQAVDDVTNDNASTYVETSVTGNKDYYTFEDLPGSITNVHGVVLKARSNTSGSGTRKVKLNLSYAFNVISSALKTLTLNTWKQAHFVADTAPDGSAWTPTKVNDTEGGVEAS